MTHEKNVLNYLKTHKRGITGLDAWTKFHCYRLSAVIFNLRQKGYDIRTDMEDNKDRRGQHARYFMMGE